MDIRIKSTVGVTMKLFKTRVQMPFIAMLLVISSLFSSQSATFAVNTPTLTTGGANLAALPTGATPGAASVMATTGDPYLPTTSTPDYFGTPDLNLKTGAGSGYATGNFANSPLPVSVLIQGSGSGALYTAVYDATSNTGSPITGFHMINAGFGYDPSTTIVSVIGGGGYGAEGAAVIDASGAITEITLTKGGSGYGTTKGIKKFVQDLPDLPVAEPMPSALHSKSYGVPGTPGYVPASDSYEIAAVRSQWKFSPDLPYTEVNMYVQVVPCSTPNSVALHYPDSKGVPNKGASVLNHGAQVCATKTNNDALAPFHYLGPTIVANKDVPVRVTFDNYLPSGDKECTSKTTGTGTGTMKCGGDLFLPVDSTVMGAGSGPNGGFYSSNRSTIHLHGGVTPWISDGTMDQWTSPADSNEQYPKGVSTRNVPDMWYSTTTGQIDDACTGLLTCAGATNDPGNGHMSFYYTNQQTARLMFYHDHSNGTTRLNVYSGIIAGYILHDQWEAQLMAAAGIRGGSKTVDTMTVNAAQEKVLVIQDKTFVPSATQLLLQDPTWNTAAWGGEGNLWFPHVYQPNQNPALIPVPTFVTSAFAAGGSGLKGASTVNLTVPNFQIKASQLVSGTGVATGATVLNVSANGVTVTLSKPAASNILGKLTFRIAASTSPGASPTGRWDYGPWFWPAAKNVMIGETTNPLCKTAATCVPGQYKANPGVPNVSAVPESFNDVMTVNGVTYPVAKFGRKVYRLQLLNGSNERTLNLSLYFAKSTNSDSTLTNHSATHCTGNLWANSATDVAPACADAGEISLVTPLEGTPGTEGLVAKDQFANHPAGVPDMGLAGPDWVQFASEGGILPDLAVTPANPIGFETSNQSIIVGNVKEHSLILGPAQRAEVFVDFTSVPEGSTLILYNDAPAPFPGFDPRFDYYTGDPDQTAFGGAPSTLPGYAPNTRTIMQIQIDNSPADAPLDIAAVTDALHKDYAATQQSPVAAQMAYDAALGTTTPTDVYPALGDNTVPVTSTGVSSISVTPNARVGTPTVQITGGNGNGARAVANVAAGNGIGKVTITNGGGYTVATLPTVTAPAPKAAGGRTAKLSTSIGGADQLGTVNVINGGSGYTSAPVVTITGASTTQAVATARLTPTTISSIRIDTGGLNTSVPGVLLEGGQAGAGIAATAVLGKTHITGITPIEGGLYNVAPILSLNPVAAGTAIAHLSTTISGLTVTSAGTGCSVDGGAAYNPSNAYFVATLTGGGKAPIQGIAWANAGGISSAVYLQSLTLFYEGFNYETAPTVTITGHNITCGTYPTAVAQLNPGPIASVEIVTAPDLTDLTSNPTVVVDNAGQGVAPTFDVAVQIAPVVRIDYASAVGSTKFYDAPAVVFDSGSAVATALLTPTSVASVYVDPTTGRGSGYATPPTITLDAPVAMSTTAVGSTPVVRGVASSSTTVTLVTANPEIVVGMVVTGTGIQNGTATYVTSITGTALVLSRTATLNGSTLTFTTSAATATSTMLSAGGLSITVVDPGSGYTSADEVGGKIPLTLSRVVGGATASASRGDGSVYSITVTNPGSGYISAPTVSLIYPTGAPDTTSAKATIVSQNVVMTYAPKGIMEEFETMYGRMDAIMSSELPSTNWANQTSVPWSSVDSPTELIDTNQSSVLVGAGTTPVASLPDGTQIWRYTHNGVDTHFMHFHMFNVQVIARFGWDGVIQPLAAYDLGWRDTVQFDPLTILYIAVKPVVPIVPWSLPNSIRPLSASEAIDMPGMMMSASDPTNNPITQTNVLVNFGWEYMVHCHLLGHEEGDMMRPIVVGVVLNTPELTSVTKKTTSTIVWRTTGRNSRTCTPTPANTATCRSTTTTTTTGHVVFVDKSNNESGFLIQRRTSGTTNWSTVTTISRAAPVWDPVTQTATDDGLSTGITEVYEDTTVRTGTSYEYRVIAFDSIGAQNMGAFPSSDVQSDPSTTAYVTI